MARFYFHMRDERGLIPDEEGGEYQGLAEALAEASASARDLAKQYVDSSAPPLDVWIEVADESGAVLMTLPLSEIFCRPGNSAEQLFDAHMRADKALTLAKRVHVAIKQALAQEQRELDSRDAAEDSRWRDEERELTEAARSSNDR